MSSLRSLLPRAAAALLALAAAAAAQSTVLTYQGHYHGAEFGSVLAYGDDYDGDHSSHRDFLVGCPEDDTAGEDAGAVYVISGESGAVIRAHFGAAAGDRFGSSLATFYDVTGDLVFDYAIGAPFADSNGADAGRVDTYSGADGSLKHTTKGFAAGDRFGSALATLGNFYAAINDPTPTVALAIGAPYADGPAGIDSGAVFIRTPFGVSMPLPPSENRGIQASEHYGATIGAGGFALIVGAPDYDSVAGSNAGRYDAWNVYNAMWLSSKTCEVLWSIAGTAAGGRLGSAVSIVGWPEPSGVALATDQYAAGAPSAALPYVDVSGKKNNGDWVHLATLTGHGGFGSAIASEQSGTFEPLVAVGAPDLVVGAVERGRVTLYKEGAVDHVVDGGIPGERFGAALACFDGEFLMGGPLASGAVANAGRVEIQGTWSFQSNIPAPAGDGDRAGSAVTGVGDIDGDGVPDVLVGSPDADSSVSFPIPGERIDCGSARVLSGATGAVLRTHLGGADGDHLGASVASLGDINLDGVADYAIGAPQNDNTTTTAGYAIAVSGQTGSTLFTMTGFFNGGEFGAAVGGGSDVNGDGRLDVIVGSPGISTGGVSLFSGVNGALLGALNGQAAGDRFGAAVAGLGADLDGDGRQEYLVGAPYADFLGTADAGRAYVMRSYTSFLVINSSGSTTANDHAGWSVAAAGDVNKDGIADYVVGVPGYDAAFSNAGRANVISGAAGIAQQIWTVSGGGPADEFGTSVTGLGDVNGDGWADWAAGAWEPGIILGSGGYVKIMSGKDNTQLMLLDGPGGDGLGWSIASAGDVDLDGVRDIIAGAPFNDDNGVDSGYASVFSLSTGLPVWTDLGYALAGSLGLPSLDGTGSLLAGTPGALTLSNARPSALSYLFIAFTALPTPFKGGTFVPVPPVLTLVLVTDASGGIALGWPAWPAGLSGLDLYFQAVIQDPGAIKGAALSNALKADVP